MAGADGITRATEIVHLARLPGQEMPLARDRLQVFQEVRNSMPLKVLVGACHEDRKDIEKAIARVIDEVDSELNCWNPESTLSKINDGKAGVPVKAPHSLVAVLRIAKHASELTNGLFDPTVGALVGTSDRSAAVGWEHLSINFETAEVTKLSDSLRVDLCGVAKGWAVDNILEAIEDLGHDDVFVDWGGDVRCAGVNPLRGMPWCCAVEGSEGGTLCTLQVENTSLATSAARNEGGYNIRAIHPKLRGPGRVTASSVSSVTVQASTCALADALATALMLFPDVPAVQQWASSHLTVVDRVLAASGEVPVLASDLPMDEDNGTPPLHPAIVAQAKELLKVIPHHVVVVAANLATQLGPHAAAVSSMVLGLSPSTVVFSIMRPSVLCSHFESATPNEGRFTVYYPTTPPDHGWDLGTVVGEGGELLLPTLDGAPSAEFVVASTRVVGDHLLVTAALRDGAAVAATKYHPVLRQFRTYLRAVSPIRPHVILDTPALVSAGTTLYAARGVRALSHHPFYLTVLPVLPSCPIGQGQPLRIHILSIQQEWMLGHLEASGGKADLADTPFQFLNTSEGGVEFALEYGHFDCVLLNGSSKDGVLLCELVEAKAVDKAKDYVLLKDPVGGSSVKYTRKPAPAAMLLSLIQGVLTYSILVGVVAWWCVAPNLIVRDT